MTAEPENPRAKEKVSWGYFAFLGLAFIVTLIFASVDAVEEGLGPSLSAKVALGAVASQVPGLILSWLRRRNKSGYLHVMLWPACVVATTGVAVYTMYAFDGKSDSIRSAGHVHVVMFPILHCVIAIFAYAVVAIPASVVYMIKRRR